MIAQFFKDHWHCLGSFVGGAVVTSFFAQIAWSKIALVGGIGLVFLVAWFVLKNKVWERYDNR